MIGSTQDATFIYPPDSPLPGGGNAVADHVADEAGRHYVGVTGGDGVYDVTVEAYRPRLDTERPVQTLFLDFDGARVNTGIWGGPGVRELRPLRAFLARWGLTHADLDPLIDAHRRHGRRRTSRPTCRQRPEPRLPPAGSSTAATTPTRSASRTSAGSSSAARSPSPASRPSASPSPSTRATSAPRNRRWCCSTC